MDISMAIRKSSHVIVNRRSRIFRAPLHPRVHPSSIASIYECLHHDVKARRNRTGPSMMNYASKVSDFFPNRLGSHTRTDFAAH